MAISDGWLRSTACLLALQVPLCLATACYDILSRLYDNSGHGSSSSSRASSSASPPIGTIRPGQVVVNQRCLVLRALHMLLSYAAVAGVLSESHGMSVESATHEEHVPSQQAAFAEQLNQSGLLQILPAVITAVADQLEAYLGTQQHSSQQPQSVGTNTQPSEGPAAGPTGAPLSSSGCASSSSSLENHPSAARPYHGEEMEPELEAISSVVYWLLRCWPGHQFLQQVAPGCAAPLMRLAALTFQHISRELTSEQQLPERLHELDKLQKLAHSLGQVVVCSAVAGLRSPDRSRLERTERDLVQSASSYLPCVALMIAFNVYMGLLLQLPALPDSSSTTTTTAGGSNTTFGSNGSNSVPTVQSLQDPVKAWQFACSQHQLLPASHHHLLQMLGCNSRAVLWVAAATAGSEVTPFTREKHSQVVESVHSYVVLTSQLYCTIAGQEQSMQQQQVQREQEQVQEQEQAASDAAGPAPHNGVDTGCVDSKETAQQLRIMLPAVLFYLPAHLPINHKADWVRDCYWAVESFRGWSGLPAVELLVTSSPAESTLSAVRDVCQDLLLLTLDTSSKVLQVLNTPGSNSTDSGSSGCGEPPTGPLSIGVRQKDMATSWLPLLLEKLVVVGGFSN